MLPYPHGWVVLVVTRRGQGNAPAAWASMPRHAAWRRKSVAEAWSTNSATITNHLIAACADGNAAF